MSKKQQQQTVDPMFTLSKEAYDQIKDSLWIIEQLNEIACFTPVESSGYLQVVTDMAENIRKHMGIEHG